VVTIETPEAASRMPPMKSSRNMSALT
jgi:hypothetical protein